MFYYTGLVNSKTLINVKTLIKETFTDLTIPCVSLAIYYNHLLKGIYSRSSTRESDINNQPSLQKVKNKIISKMFSLIGFTSEKMLLLHFFPVELWTSRNALPTKSDVVARLPLASEWGKQNCLSQFSPMKSKIARD